MKILGVDPGTLACGYAILESDGRSSRALDYGVVRSRDESLPVRLKVIYEGLLVVIDRWKPDVAVVESLFSGINAQTALKIGEGRGVALLAAAGRGLPVFEYAPAEVKKSVVGTGRAHKSQVQEMVRLILSLPELPEPEDAADALAVAICHSHRLDMRGG